MQKCLNCEKEFKESFFTKQSLCNKCIKDIKNQNISKNKIKEIYNKFTYYCIKFDNSNDTIFDYIIKNIDKKSKIIEIGSGGGHLSKKLYRQGYHRIILSDFNYKLQVKVKQKSPYLSILICNAENIPIKNKSIDVILSFQLIEHLFDIDKHLNEVKNILSKNGSYIFITPNKIWDVIYFKIIKRIKDQKIWHPSCINYFQLKRKILNHGFTVKFINYKKPSVTEKNKIPNIFGMKNLLIKFIYYFFPVWLKPNFICICKLK